MSIKSVYASSDGIYVTGLNPTFAGLKRESTGVDYSTPVITEVGFGWYKFDIDAPSDDKLLGVVNFGGSVGISNRYKEFEIDYYDNERIYDRINVANDHKEVFVMPVYDSDSDSITFFCYLLENGQIVTSGLSSITVNVYDNSNTLLFTETETNNTNGVFIVVKTNPTLNNGDGYYLKAEITKDDTTTIQSVETYVALD